eukprot:Opistho-2@83778
MNILGRLTLTLVVLFTVSVCTTVALYPDSNGPIKVIHAFSGGDGAKSKGSLSLVQCPPYKQVLYGFTAEGGKFGGGVVFAAGFVGSVVDGASFAVVHDFEVPQTRKSKDQNATDVDGYEPHHGALTPDCKRGLLFGTALGGGSANEGVIFSVGLAPPHTFSVLHAFDAGPKHGGPHSGLIAVQTGAYTASRAPVATTAAVLCSATTPTRARFGRSIRFPQRCQSTADIRTARSPCRQMVAICTA